VGDAEGLAEGMADGTDDGIEDIEGAPKVLGMIMR
jgi:hypothetical protein